MDKIKLLSLASDLKRICLSIQRNSLKSSARFNKEATKWLVETKNINNPSLKNLLKKIGKTLEKKDDLIKAEDCLMYSVLLQNRALSGAVRE